MSRVLSVLLWPAAVLCNEHAAEVFGWDGDASPSMCISTFAYITDNL